MGTSPIEAARRATSSASPMCRQSRSSREGRSPVKELPSAGVQAPKPRDGPCQRRPRGRTGGRLRVPGGCLLLWILGVSIGLAGTYVPVSTTDGKHVYALIEKSAG